MSSQLTFGPALDERERVAAYRLRYDELIARGWGTPSDYPDGLERDEYDESAVLVVARRADEVVGSVRLIVDATAVERLLPEYGIEDGAVPVSGTAVAGRYMLARPYRRSREAAVGLLAALWRAAVEHGVERGVTFQTEASIRWCGLHGAPVKVIGPARQDRGEWRYPLLVDTDVVAAFAASATQRERELMPLHGKAG